MGNKKEIVTKTYGTSWISSIFIAIIAGFIGAILANASGQALMGFLVGFVMVFATEFILLACCIPFVGIYLYWIWSCWFYNWIINIAFVGNQTLINNFLMLSLFPLILFAVFGAIIFVIFSVLAVVLIGAVISALSS
jgi:hypothetical protein